jgi:hypothetical protein
MFHEALNDISGELTLFNLLEKLSLAGFIKKEVCPDSVTEDDLQEAWEYFDEDPAKAVNYLETMHGFLFEQEFEKTQEATLGMRDWNRVVATAKDVVTEIEDELNIERLAKDKLAKIYTFLSDLDVSRAIKSKPRKN